MYPILVDSRSLGFRGAPLANLVLTWLSTYCCPAGKRGNFTTTNKRCGDGAIRQPCLYVDFGGLWDFCVFGFRGAVAGRKLFDRYFLVGLGGNFITTKQSKTWDWRNSAALLPNSRVWGFWGFRGAVVDVAFSILPVFDSTRRLFSVARMQS